MSSSFWKSKKKIYLNTYFFEKNAKTVKIEFSEMVFEHRKIRLWSIHRWIRLVILRRMVYNTTHLD